METIQETLTITGMTCDGCARSVRAALLRVPGITEAVVDHAAGSATISGSGIDRNAIATELTEAGFELQ